MSFIRPFRAVRFNTQTNPDVSTRIAPPYDVLDSHDKQALLDRDPNNFVRVDLPHMPPKDAGPPAAYQQAADTIAAWLADGTLVREDQPSIYAYHQKYTHNGRAYLRRKFFARLKLENFGEGSVFPHEKTFGGPKEDRLALTKAAKANLSPIFGLYEDASNTIADRLQAALPPKPVATGTLDGVENTLWAINDVHVVDDVIRMMQPKPIFIADGHHRYGTSLMYRDWLSAQTGGLAPDHPANYVLCVFCGMEDPGCLILPTHRVLPKVRCEPEFFRGDTNIELLMLDVTDVDSALRALTPLGPQALGVFFGSTGRFGALRPARPTLLDANEKDHCEAWRRLALAFLHAYVIDRAVTPKLNGGAAPEIHYVKVAAAAIDEARAAGGTTFLMQPNTMQELRAVCQAGDLMPQKSTFFYPKLASGLLINPLSQD